MRESDTKTDRDKLREKRGRERQRTIISQRRREIKRK